MNDILKVILGDLNEAKAKVVAIPQSNILFNNVTTVSINTFSSSQFDLYAI